MHSPHPHDTPPHAIPAHRPTHARLEVDLARGEFTDALGRRVMLRGVNVGGRSKLPPYLPFELDDVDSDDEVQARAERIFENLGLLLNVGCQEKYGRRQFSVKSLLDLSEYTRR